MKRQGFRFAALALLATLMCAPEANAQLLQRWFGPRAPDKNPPAKLAQADARRVTEINVEVAWLADSVTFPYYLEAHVTGSKLEVRGYVPSKAVREHALRIAQVYSSLPVADSMKEHPSLAVKSSKMSAPQLQKSALSSLRVALPKQYQQLKVECGADGKVFVLGTVNTLDDKMAVSNSLRRLHGCTSVQNLTLVPNELAQNPPPDRTPIVKTSNPKETKTDKPMAAQDNKSKPWINWPWSRNNTPTTDEPPLLNARKPDPKKPIQKDGPILIQNVPDPKFPEFKKKPDVVKVELPGPAPKTPLTVAELKKRILAACPQAKSVEVKLAANQELQITVEIRAESEISPVAERVFALPELQNYRADLQFKISAP
ncbi:MAG: hypothetical protein EXR98_07235 [Gemmataceae bacterium]|nr:hypothetical protein [Gemmataceae bacterium]